jgi:hypothetical protein
LTIVVVFFLGTVSPSLAPVDCTFSFSELSIASGVTQSSGNFNALCAIFLVYKSKSLRFLQMKIFNTINIMLGYK